LESMPGPHKHLKVRAQETSSKQKILKNRPYGEHDRLKEEQNQLEDEQDRLQVEQDRPHARRIGCMVRRI
jgi:hypothetical protein